MKREEIVDVLKSAHGRHEKHDSWCEGLGCGTCVSFEQAIAALTRDALPPGIEASEYRAKCLDADVGLESCRRSVFDDTLADLERHLIANRWTRHAAGWRCPYCENWRNR